VNGLKQTDLVPADAVTASASGLDPQISVRNAELQAARVAKARGVAEEKVRELVVRFTDDPGLGILGDAGVRVLELNLALDTLR
jgi:K+-transporting ATPase ATPase C chain